MSTNPESHRNGALYGAHTIIETATGFPVDVIIGAALTFRLIDRWESANPGIRFSSRPSTNIESGNAHIIQIDASREFIVPAECI